MILKILVSILCFQSLSNLQCCEFDKDCFHIFINSLYSRNAFDIDAKIIYLSFKNPNDEKLFVKKIKLRSKIICFKKSKDGNEKNLLKINSITKSESNTFVVDFTSQPYQGKSYFGTVEIGFEETKPIFINAYIVSQIE